MDCTNKVYADPMPNSRRSSACQCETDLDPMQPGVCVNGMSSELPWNSSGGQSLGELLMSVLL